MGNVTVPKSVVAFGTSPAVYVDKQLAAEQGFSQDAENYYVWCTLPFSREVSIVFSGAESAISEFALGAILLVGVAVCVAVVFKLKKR